MYLTLFLKTKILALVIVTLAVKSFWQISAYLSFFYALIVSFFPKTKIRALFITVYQLNVKSFWDVFAYMF